MQLMLNEIVDRHCKIYKIVFFRSNIFKIFLYENCLEQNFIWKKLENQGMIQIIISELLIHLSKTK